MVERRSVNTSGEWRRALEVSERLIRTTSELELEPRNEWLRQVMNEAASQLRAAVLWAAAQGVTVRLSVPYDLSQFPKLFDGWVVVQHVPMQRHAPLVMTT